MTDAPERFSDDFLRAVGAVVVAGGQVEHELHRLLMALQGESISGAGDGVRVLTWGQCLKRIEALAPTAPNADDIAEALKSGRGLEASRNHVVHAEWRGDGYGSRHPRGGRSVMVFGSTEELETLAASMQRLTIRLIAVNPDPARPPSTRVPPLSVSRPHE